MTTETQPTDIPEAVLEILEMVRSSGKTNMMDRNTVIHLALKEADATEGQQDREAVEWLVDNDGRYMEALKAASTRIYWA